MKKVRFVLGFAFVLGILFSTGCQKMDLSDQKGNLVIKLTDAPFPIDMVDSANVRIVKVEIREVCDCDEDGSPFITLYEESEPDVFNLLDLRDGKTAGLVDTLIEPGTYDLIRVYVDEVGLKVKEEMGGESYSLKVPSGAQTGIKVFMAPALKVVGGLTSEVVLDVDLNRSFVIKGNADSPAGIKGFNFKPVIKAINSTTDGTVAGYVMNSDTAIHEAPVWIDEDTVYTDTAGYYSISGLLAGQYTISATFEGFDTVTVEGLNIVEGNLTEQDFILTKLEDPEGESEGI